MLTESLRVSCFCFANLTFNSSSFFTKDIAISSFLSTLLASEENMTVLKAVILTEILMEKLPAIFIIYFKREGVVDAV